MATLALALAVSQTGLTGGWLVAANFAAAAIGAMVDNRLFGPKPKGATSPRLNEVGITGASETDILPRVFGRARVQGQVIWCTRFKETTRTAKVSGGKGSALGGGSQKSTEYLYSVSVAYALCEGSSKVSLGRAWADGDLLDLSDYNYRFYEGTETQIADPKIVAVEGSAPAFRGTAYVVFEDLPLEKFGNRVPQMAFEVIRPVEAENSLENSLRAVNLIPATGEFAYGTTVVTRVDQFGNSVTENAHLSKTKTDVEISLEELFRVAPNVQKINLVCAWFGDDLRAGHCQIEPKVESRQKATDPVTWSVSGVSRAVAQEVSEIAGSPTYGGTPSDSSILESISLIGETHYREIWFYPFLLMDIPSGNTLPNLQGGVGQPAHPWRGRVAVLDSSQKTATAQSEIDLFFGNVSASDFSVSSEGVTYTGSSSDKGYRRMILHYAHLCALGANRLSDKTKFKAFYVGTEMVDLNRSMSDNSGTHPAVDKFLQLLADVRAIFDSAGLSHVQLSYAADWSEWHSHRPSDGSGDVWFHLDPLWADANCSFIAIDNYMSLSDWRDGISHADYGEGFTSFGTPKAKSLYDENYLRSQIEGGENYHWFYANDSARQAQSRTPIADDSGFNEPWVFRNKDIRNWWLNAHRDRPAGVRSGSTTAWIPQSKRVVFSEFGCPAVDKGTNQPNVFFDSKSSESALPFFSTGREDPQIQRLYHTTLLNYWRDNSPAGMLSDTEMFAWTWDARPYPIFPFNSAIWTDSSNWRLGHWLNGRLGSGPLAEIILEICAWNGLGENDIDVSLISDASTIVDGYVIDAITSSRDALEPLITAYFLDVFESEGRIRFRRRGDTTISSIVQDEMPSSDGPPISVETIHVSELPAAVRLSYVDKLRDYEVSTVESRRNFGDSLRVREIAIPLISDESHARSAVSIMRQEVWASRNQYEFTLPLSRIALEPGDVVETTFSERTHQLKIATVDVGETLKVDGVSYKPSIYGQWTQVDNRSFVKEVSVPGSGVLYFMDLPLFFENESSPWAPRVATYQNPFPTSVEIYEDTGTDTFSRASLSRTAQTGLLVEELPKGDPFVVNRAASMVVDWADASFQLLSASEEVVRNGENVLAVRNGSGRWEIVKFLNAVPISSRRYRLEGLFRGQFGTETDMGDPTPIGEPVVLLDLQTITNLDLTFERRQELITYLYGPGDRPIGSSFYKNAAHAGEQIGLLPYAVADLRFVKEGNQTIFSWQRQTRVNGESFEDAAVALNEDSEIYEYEIRDEFSTLVATNALTTNLLTVVDFPVGGSLTVWQISAAAGRGRPNTITVGA
jgi:hypothetical protein